MRRALISALVLGSVALPAYAQDVAGVDQLLTRFQTVTASWGGPLQALMLGTFGTLAVVDLAYFVGCRNLMGRGDISTFMHSLVHEVLYLSFFFWLLTTYQFTGPLIIKSFQFAARQAGGIPMQPNAIFAEGLKIASTILHQVSIVHPGDSISMVLCGLVVLGCFAWITASMVYVIVESYFVVSAGQILLMFGGSHFTSDMAQSLLRTCVGIGLKLYALQLIASVGSSFVAAWVAEVHDVTFDGIMIEIGEALILAAITGRVPAMFERMVGGAGAGSAGDLVAAGGALGVAGSVIGKAAAKAIAQASGGAAATASAARLASAQGGTSGSPDVMSAEARAIRMVASTTRNLAAAAVEDIGRGLRGQRGNQGQMPWRMSANMGEQRRLLEEARNKPKPPTPPQGKTP